MVELSCWPMEVCGDSVAYAAAPFVLVVATLIPTVHDTSMNTAIR